MFFLNLDQVPVALLKLGATVLLGRQTLKLAGFRFRHEGKSGWS